MNRNASLMPVGRRSYRLLLTLATLIFSASVAVCVSMGREAALGCLIWSTASALPISLLATAIGSIVEELRHTEAREGKNEKKHGST